MSRLLFLIGFLFVLPARGQYTLVQELSDRISEDSLLTYVRQLTGLLPVETSSGTASITTRYIGTAGNQLAADYIRQKLLGWGIACDVTDFSPTGQNLVGKIPGRRSDRIMLIGAHYDAVNGSPGADDNASGTAAVLEIARVCAGLQFPVTLHFAFWDEEEQGLLGSRASAPDYMQSRLVGYVNLDMIAYDSNNDSSFDIHGSSAGYSTEMAQRAYNLVSLYQVPLRPRLIIPGDPSTDHGAFWQNNLSAIGINEEYNGDFTPHWHRFSDSITHFNQSYFFRMSRFAGLAFMHFAMDSNNLVGIGKADDLNDMVDVYPNPFTSEIKWSEARQASVSRIELLDAAGQTVYASPVAAGQRSIVAGDIKQGMYYLLLYDRNGYVYRKKLVRN